MLRKRECMREMMMSDREQNILLRREWVGE